MDSKHQNAKMKEMFIFFKKIFVITLIFFALNSFGRREKTSNDPLDQKQKSIHSRKAQLKQNYQKNLKVLLRETKGPIPFKVELIIENQGVPWGMLFLNNNELLWTERAGKIKKIHLPTGDVNLIAGGPKPYAKGQGGLLDIILHPEFKTNQWIYFTYSIQKKGRQSTALARGKLKGNKIIGLKTLWTAKPFYSGARHFGSRLAFDEQGFIFMTMGDRGRKQEAQNLSSHLGKLLRFNDKGQAVSDNPFVKIKGAQPEIWTWGHRNPQGLFIHPETKKIYLQDHGPKGGDEINLIKKGANYGWPIITHGRAYSGLKIGEGTHKKGMEQAIKYWTPSIAPCGLLIYSGEKFIQWKGDFFSGALALTHLNKLKIKNNTVTNEQRLLSSLNLRFRHVIESPQGLIYASVDEGMILKISPL